MNVKNRSYFVLPGLVILVCFVLVAFFLNSRLNKAAGEIAYSLTHYVQGQKSTFFTNEFQNILRNVDLAAELPADADDAGEAAAYLPLLPKVLLADSSVNRAWYGLLSGADTSIYFVGREGALIRSPAAGYFRQLILKDAASGAGRYNRVETYRDTTYWLYGAGRLLPDGSVLIAGVVVNMYELQHYLSEADPAGQSFAFITDRLGRCIYSPDERYIGQQVLPEADIQKVVRRLSLGGSLTDTVESQFLKVPVVRSFSAFNVGQERWVLAVDTPTLLYATEFDAISDYTLLLGGLAVLVIIATGVYSLRKWLREFVLRQQAESKQKTLLLDKQKLLLEAEKQQKENALLQLDKLKEKINPHFLFNSLGSLNALIGKDTVVAKDFVLKLSKVYRYVLNDFAEGLSTVEQELNFSEQYNFLLQVRFKEALGPLNIRISEQHLRRRIPFMSLQTAVENAIKHNVVAKDMPLFIKIESEGDFIVVSNNIQPRNTPFESSKQGLRYLEGIYQYHGVDGFRHGEYDGLYKCLFPML